MFRQHDDEAIELGQLRQFCRTYLATYAEHHPTVVEEDSVIAEAKRLRSEWGRHWNE